jgi:hypothetical protein
VRMVGQPRPNLASAPKMDRFSSAKIPAHEYKNEKRGRTVRRMRV